MGMGLWRLHSQWLEDQAVMGACTKAIADFWHLSIGTVSPSSELEAYKAPSCGTLMSVTGILRKNNGSLTEELESAMLQTSVHY